MTPYAQRLWLPVLTAAAAAVVVAMLGFMMTDLGPWYRQLTMPSWKPPDALFGPAWTVIFACAALAAAQGWRTLTRPAARFALCGFFALNAGLNVLWSVLFFRLHQLHWAVLEVGLLWLSIVVLMFALWRGSRLASWLLLPYLLWVSYAALLNMSVARLNPS
jgi:translocator protein